jgi:predicted HTH transcriptional regulator
MILKPFEQIAEDDLLALITDAVSEDRTIDYKGELPGYSDGDKKEVLADVSSFANTSGGDLVFGIDEAEGLPTQLDGFESANAKIDTINVDGNQCRRKPRSLV